MRLAGDPEDDFIHVPLVVVPGPPPTDDVGELLAKLQTPLPDRLMADLNAPEGQHLLDHPKAQGKAEVQPDGVADPFRREAVAGVEGLGRARHGRLIPDLRRSGNPPRRQLDGASGTAPRSGRAAGTGRVRASSGRPASPAAASAPGTPA